VQNAKLFDWLLGLYESGGRIDFEAVKLGSQILDGGNVALGLHHHQRHVLRLPARIRVKAEAVIEVLPELGIAPARRPAFDVPRSQARAACPPTTSCRTNGPSSKIANGVIESFTMQTVRMTRVDLMPCSPFSITFDLLKETRALARRGARKSRQGGVASGGRPTPLTAPEKKTRKFLLPPS